MKVLSPLGTCSGGARAVRPAARPTASAPAPRATDRGLVRVAACFDLKDSEDPGQELEERKPRRFSRRSRSFKRDHPDPTPPDHDLVELVELCVGGRTVVTTRSTLLQVPGSALHELFCQDNLSHLPRSSKGEIFLDYEPYMFGLVLRFLRELKMGGLADPSLSSFRQEDRAHLLVMLRHLRLLPQQGPGPAHRQQQQQQQQQQGHMHAQPSLSAQPHTLQAGASAQEAAAAAAAAAAFGRSSFTQQCPAAQQSQKGQHLWQQQQQQAGSGEEIPKAPAAPPSPPLVPARSTTHNAKGSEAAGGHKQKQAKAPSTSGSASSSSSSSSSHPKDQPVKLVAPPVPRPVSSSQLYYIQAQYEERRGIKISVYTESDLHTLAMTEPFDIFCDATASEGQLSFTFVCRQDFDNMFVGITTRSHTDRKGSQVPCFGWKRTGCIYSGSSTRSGGPEERWCPLPAATSPGGRPGQGQGQGQGQGRAQGGGGGPNAPLWGKGDSVELIVALGDVVNQPRMVMKVNGKEMDHIAYLPPLRSWSWYVALYMGSDMSCVTFMSDSYAVFWGDYQVKRFLA